MISACCLHILLCNHKCIEFGKPHAYLKSVHALENSQWCREPWFAGTAISVDELLPQISKQDRHQLLHVRFEDFMVMTMKNAIFWDVTPCGSCKNRHFGGT
jgi:hypothetical protein